MSETQIETSTDIETGEVSEAPSTDVVVKTENGAFLGLRFDQRWWTDQQIAVLQTIGLEDADKYAMGGLLHAAQTYKLDPFAKQISMIPRKQRSKGTGGQWVETTRWSLLILLDGYLALASRTGRFLGIDGPYWLDQDKQWTDVWVEDYPPLAARVGVRYLDRAGRAAVQEATVTYKSRVQIKKGYQGAPDEPMALWKTMPEEMLANGAIRKALRIALPEAVDTVVQGLDEHSGMIPITTEQIAAPESVPAIHANQTSQGSMQALGRVSAEDPFGLDDDANAVPVVSDANPHTDGSDIHEATIVEGEPICSAAQRQKLGILAKELDIVSDMHARMQARFDVSSSKDLTVEQASTLIEELEAEKRSGLNKPVPAEDVAAHEEAHAKRVAFLIKELDLSEFQVSALTQEHSGESLIEALEAMRPAPAKKAGRK